MLFNEYATEKNVPLNFGAIPEGKKTSWKMPNKRQRSETFCRKYFA